MRGVYRGVATCVREEGRESHLAVCVIILISQERGGRGREEAR